MCEYEEYLKREKHLSKNSIQAYLRDLKQFKTFSQEKGVSQLSDTGNVEILGFLMDLKEAGSTKATLNRKLASLRTYFDFLRKIGQTKENPTEGIKTPRIEKKEIEFLSINEITSVLAQPDDTIKGKRDRAILELLYATGIRASELIEMNLEDVNLTMGIVKCSGEHSRARIIPFGRLCRRALEDYINNSRPALLKGEITEVLFVNYTGKPFTRQGLWKILKEYGKGAGLVTNLTPQVIRNSFAVHLLQNGADVKSLQELMGHEDISAAQAYLAVTKYRIKDVYDRSHPRA